MPLGVSAADTVQVTPEAVTEDVTIQDVTAGAATPDELPYEYETLKVPEEQQWISVKPSDDESVQAEADYSLNTTIIDNGDGTHTMTLYDYPVKYINSDGEIEDISLEIASASDGSYRTKANDIQTVFPKKISDGISLSGKGVSIKLKPSVPTASSGNISATANATQITSDSTVTKLDNETVSYYYDSRTTLEYSLTYTGFKEDIVVSEYTGQTEYTFLLETGGLTLTRIDGSYYLTDENGEVKATLGDIIIFTADERNNTMGSMTHVTVRENQQYLITIHVDADYLKDENTAYPIRIDPTIEITYDSNGAGAIQDVTLNELSGSSGSSGSMYVGKRGTYGISRTLMKFPGLNLSAIPSNSTINSAYIEIRDLMCETTAMNVNACMFLGDDWDESTANWTDTNSNLYYSLNGGSVSVSYSNGDALDPKHRYSLNITRAVKLWRSGLYDDSKGIMLKADSSVENGSSSLYKTFASYNRASNKPSLVINYTSNVTHTAYGWLGFVNSSVINGWVWCSNHPSEALDIVLTITNTTTDQAWRTAGIANVYRSDVEEAGFGTGNYGFSLGMGDWTAFPPGTYSVSAVAVLPNGSTYTLHASPKTHAVAVCSQVLAEGDYYINNKEHGVYLGMQDGAISAKSGQIDSLEDSVKFLMMKNAGGYVLRSYLDLDLCLGIVQNQSNDMVAFSEPGDTISEAYIWDLYVIESGSGEYYLRNRYNDKYLYTTGLNFYVDGNTGTYDTDINRQHTWRIIGRIDLVNKELDEETTISTLQITQGQSATFSIHTNPSDAVWVSHMDFYYVCMSTNYVSVSNGVFTGNAPGITTVVAVHKPTMLEFVFAVVVGEIPNYTVENYVDIGYTVRHGGYTSVSEYNQTVANKLKEIFGVNMTYNVYTCESPADVCKVNQFDAVTDSTLAKACIHQTDCHLSCDTLRGAMGNGTQTITRTLWTGHILEGNARSNSMFYPYSSVIMTPANVTIEESGFINKTDYEVRNINLYELLHELSHQLGAPDHYCYGPTESGKCVNEYCDRCVYEMESERPCLMTSHCNIEIKDASTLYCKSCVQIINSHLKHHQ